MSAPTQTQPHPTTPGGVDTRLPWWALALPALAFITLLLLILRPSGAHAATGDPAVTELLHRAQELLAR